MRGSGHGPGIGAARVAVAGATIDPAGHGLEWVRVAYDDLGALDAALDERAAALIVEPVQVDAGVRVPRDGFLAAVAERCRRAGALLVVDEVRTALRMGPTLASAKPGVEPDIVCLGSSLAGGLPFGVAAVGPSLARRARPGRSTSDNSGQPLVCAAANATIRTALSPTVRTLAELTGSGCRRGCAPFASARSARSVGAPPWSGSRPASPLRPCYASWSVAGSWPSTAARGASCCSLP